MALKLCPQAGKRIASLIRSASLQGGFPLEEVMPELGEIKKAIDLGYKGYYKYIWVACVNCGKERWVEYIIREAAPKKSLCYSCSRRKSGHLEGIKLFGKREAHLNWRGGRYKTCQGYICIKLSPDDPFFPMVHEQGYVFEHRLVMARHLGRCLQPWEVIHHKNGDITDNRIENLQLFISRGQHTKYHWGSKRLTLAGSVV